MFKKIASIILAAMLICSMAVIAVSAVETDGAVAAADESAVGADDNSAVGADDNSAVGADDASDSTGSDGKIYFDANSAGWKNFTDITLFLYEHESGDKLIQWGSKKGKMKDGGNGIWSFDLQANYPLDESKSYACIFTADWGMQTCDLMIGTPCYGDTAYCTGNQVENNVDSNKKSYEVKWKNADSSKYGNPVCITSIGNVIGSSFWPGDTAYSVFLKFISTDDESSIVNALKYNGKSEQETIDDAASALGLGQADIEKAIKESGKTFKWTASSSKAQKGSTTGGGDNGGGDNGGGNDSNGGGSNGGSNGGGSGSGSTGSVTSGEESTIYFILGGVMLAAIGVFFLARRRRDY